MSLMMKNLPHQSIVPLLGKGRGSYAMKRVFRSVVPHYPSAISTTIFGVYW
jgi:hypothetical protein